LQRRDYSMDFYVSYQRLLSEMGSDITTTQRSYLEKMKASYVFAKTQYDTADNILKGVERQKGKLEHKVEELEKRRNQLAMEIQSMTPKVAKLREKQKTVRKKIAILESSYRSKSIGKGIYEKKYQDAMNLLSQIHKYTAINRCKTKETFEKSIRLKVETLLKIEKTV
jgi:septal ring factor EnvC (AmiA/AmiB activator)